MTLELELRTPAGEPVRHTIDAPVSLGGSRSDGIHAPGLPPAALELEPCPTGIVLVNRVAGLRVSGQPVAPGGRRLLRPGEHALILGIDLTVAAPPRAVMADGTRAAAAAVLRQAALGLGDQRGPALLVLDGPAAGTPLPLRDEQVIGRGRSARLRLVDPATSRRHARLRLVPGGATVEDLGAKNGVRVNGVRLEPGPAQLHPGDVLTVGETTLAFQSPDAAAPARRPVAPRTAEPRGAARGPRPGPRVPFAREPLAPLLWAVLLAVVAAGLLAAACG